MGIIPRPPEYGSDCEACFAPGETPLNLKAFFSGVQRGEQWHSGLPLPPNGYYDITQEHLGPCVWRQVEVGYPDIYYRVGGPSNTIRIYVDVGIIAFRSVHPTGCRRYFQNDYEIWGGNFYYGGYCYLTTSNSLQQQIEKVTPLLDPDPRMECFVQPDGEIAVRYAGKQDGTKIYFIIDPDA